MHVAESGWNPGLPVLPIPAAHPPRCHPLGLLGGNSGMLSTQGPGPQERLTQTHRDYLLFSLIMRTGSSDDTQPRPACQGVDSGLHRVLLT